MKRNNKLCDVLRVCFAKNEKKTFPKLRLQFLKYDFNSPTSGKCAGEGEFQAMAKSRFEAKLCLVSCQLHWGLSLSLWGYVRGETSESSKTDVPLVTQSQSQLQSTPRFESAAHLPHRTLRRCLGAMQTSRTSEINSKAINNQIAL